MLCVLRLKILGSTKRIAVNNSFLNPRVSLNFFSVISDKTSFVADENAQRHSFTVSYLVNSCGMSLETALSVSSKVNFETPTKPDLVLALLRNQGFTTTQISKVVKNFPSLLLFNCEKTLLPKFEYLHSIGLSESECVEIVHSCPFILGSSLKNHLIPCYNFLKIVLREDKKVIKCMKRSPRAFRQDVQDKIAPNIALLRNSGVSEISISFLVSNFPDSAFLKHSKFCNIVDRVREFGFDPCKIIFVEAIRVLSALSTSTWERKFEVYRKCGWSEDETLAAFKKFPPCLIISEEKILKTMDFFVQKMGLKSVDIAKKPIVLVFSLEKRITPRCLVVQSLYSKGLLKKELSITSFLHLTDGSFLEKYVFKFQQEAPRLLQLYEGTIKLLDV